jgi:hypothetical protein
VQQGCAAAGASYREEVLGSAPVNQEGKLEHSLLVELSPQEALALIQIANAGGIRAGTVSESDVSRLHLLGLVEQRGAVMGLTAIGIQTIARLKRG